MKEMLQNAQVIFFDMDGTLYEGEQHYHVYAQQIQKTLPAHVQEQFMSDFQRAMSNQSPLKPGTIYLKEKQWIVSVDPFTMQVLSVHSWSGEKIHAALDLNRLPKEMYIAVGDPWWIPYTCAVHLGTKPAFEAYEKTKEIMLSADYPFTHTRNLKENLYKLSQTKTLICVTNSYSEDAGSVLQRLDILKLFDHIVAPGNKPEEIKNHFERYMNLYEAAPETALSIGDNVFNEIAPAIQMGIPSILLSTWGETYQQPHLKIVSTLADML